MRKSIKLFAVTFFLALLAPQNAHAAAVDDSYSTPYETAVSGNVLSNDDGWDPQFESFLNPPSNGTLTDNGGGSFTYTPNSGFVGVDTFTYEMSNFGFTGRSYSTGTVSITVSAPPNTPPTFTSTPILTASVGAVYSYTVTTQDPNGDTVTVTATTLPSWLTFDGTTLSGTPLASDGGDHSVTLTADDGNGGTAEQIFTISVAASPTFTSTPILTASVGAAYSYTVTTHDANSGDTVTVTSSAPPPAWLSFDGTTLSGTPGISDAGDHSVTLTADDGNGGTATQSFTIHVNAPPTFTSTPILTASANAAYSYAVATQDLNGDTVTVTATTLPGWLTFDGTTLSGTPLASDGGDHSVTLTADDGNGGTAEQIFTISVAASPTFTSTPILTASVGAAYSYTVTTHDANSGDTVTVTSSAPPPAWLSFDGTTLSGTPGISDAGDHSVTLTADDGNGGTATQSFTIHVNAPPTFTSTPILTASANAAYSYAVATQDLNGDTVTVTATTLPGWLTFDGTTLSGTPLASDGGDHSVTLTADDGNGGTAEQIFTISVAASPTFTSTPILTASVGAAYSYTVTTHDANSGDTVTVTSSAPPPAWLSFDGTTLSGTPGISDAGDHSVTLTADDGNGGTAIQSFTIHVNAPPTFTSTPILTASANAAYSYTVTTHDANSGDTVTVTSSAPLPSWLTFDGTTLSGTPLASDGGDHSVTLTADDGNGGTAEQIFTISVAASPTFTSTPILTASVGAAYSYTVTTHDANSGDTVTVTSSAPPPAWLSFDGTTLSGTPGISDAGDHSVTLTADDGNGGTATQSFTIHVNAPPTFTSTPILTASANAAYSYTVTTHDANSGDTVTVTSSAPLPSWLTFDGTTLSGTPLASDIGDHSVTLTADDGNGGTATQTFTITVGTDLRETCPGVVLSTLDGTSETANQIVNDTITGDTIYYYYFTPTAAGTVQVDSSMPGATYNSLFIIDGCGSNLRAYDYNSNNKSSDEVPVNAGQTIVIAYERRYSSDQLFTLDITYTVPVADAVDDSFSTPLDTALNGNVLTNDKGPGIEVTGNTSPTNGTVSIVANGDFTYIPNPGYGGSDSFDYTITDMNDQTDTATVTITVRTPPLMKDIPNQNATTDTAFTLNILDYVTLTDGDPILSYALTGTLPAGISFNTSTGAFSGTATEDGTFNLSATATDIDGTSNADSFTLEVVGVPPTVTDETFNIDEDAGNGATVGTVSATGSPTSFAILSGDDNGTFQIDASGVITIADNTYLDFETTPSYTLSVEANNTYGSDTGTITININDVDEKLSCPGDVLSILDGTSVTANQVVSGTITGDTIYYYYFTPTAAGTVQVDSSVGASYNSLFIIDGCGANLWSDGDNSNNKSSSEVPVNAGQTIVIALERRYSSDQPFTLDITYTVPVATAVDDHFETPLDTALNENVLTNDKGPGITVTAHTDPQHGSLIIAANGDFTYTPDTSFINGTDSFTYTITDSNGNTDTATVTIDVWDETVFNGAERPFTIRNPQHTRNLTGDVQVIGNSNQCVTTSTSSFDRECTTSRSTTANTNMTKYLNTDSGTSGIFNATEATLALDANRTVVWAGLYWQGFLHECDNTNALTCRYRTNVGSDNLDLSNDSYDSHKVLFKTSSAGSYNTVPAKQLDYIYSSAAEGTIYSAYADVTSLLNLKNPNETYTVANIQSMEGRRGYGNYAAWALFVIYAYDGPDDPLDNEKSRNISVYDGFEVVMGDGYNERVTITPSGFRTPDTGTVDSKLISFAGEGEYGYTPDFIEVNGNTVSNAENDEDNVYNSSISGFTRNPSWANANGIDIDIFDVSAYILNKATSATITIGSDTDHFYQSVLAFSTELYVPNLCYDYTLDIDGHVLNSVNNQIQTPFGGFGEPLTTHLYLRSEEGDLDLADVNISYFILDTSYLHYQAGSTEISETGRFAYEDAAPWTVNETVLGFDMYIGTGVTGSSGGIIRPNEDRYIKLDSDFQTNTVDTSFSFAVNYKVDFGSGGVSYHQDFYADDLCPADQGGFLPELGIFNVVDGGAAYDQYNLYTQVTKRPFNLTVYAHDTATPTELTFIADLNLSVEVEMIRADNFNRDADVACNDEHSKLDDVPPKFPHFNIGKSIDISYEADDLNLAYRSVAMRVWYLTDPNGNGTLVNDHNCTRENDAGCADLYARDYAGTDTQCGTLGTSQCTTATEGCYDCLRSHYGRMVCSRDNFVIRPESFVTQLLDSNRSTNIDGPSNPIANSVSSASPFSVVAGYDYRFDINATNHQDNQATPRYIQHFEPGSATHWSRMIWYPDAHDSIPAHDVSGCNDVEDKNISINLFNGSDVNYHPSARTSYVDKVTQIGKYRFEIFDSNWTSADWNSAEMQHHDGNYSAYYNVGSDCENDSSDVLATTTAGKNGCEISSAHTNVDTGVVYNYLYAQYYPYEFDVSGLTIGAGPNNDESNNTFVYINTPGPDDENMSYNIQETFRAAGYNNNNENVSNFVDQCYAEDIDMSLYQSFQHPEPNATQEPYLTYDLIDFNTSDSSDIIRPREQDTFTFANDSSTAAPLPPLVIAQEAQYFRKDMDGAITMDLGYNFNREYNKVLNPRFIQMDDFNITYTTQPASVYVDLKTDHKIFGNRQLDQNVSFFYGRVKASKDFYDDVTDTSIATPISAVIYCDLGYTECQNRRILALLSQTNESDWWLSWDHDSTQGDGNITLMVGTITPSGSASVSSATTDPANVQIISSGIQSNVTVTATSANRPMTVPIELVHNIDDPSGLPYYTNTPPYTNRWLIYNRDLPEPPNPFYKVRFIGESDWAGHGDTGHVVDSNTSTKKNRRLGW